MPGTDTTYQPGPRRDILPDPATMPRRYADPATSQSRVTPKPHTPPAPNLGREWGDTHNLPTLSALENLAELKTGANWASLLPRAIPSALMAGGGTWLAHRLLAGKGETEEERKRKRWQRGLLSTTAGLLGAYGGANTAWKYDIAPELRQGLIKSYMDPRGAFSEGLHNNYANNVVRSANAYISDRGPIRNAFTRLSDAAYIPGTGQILPSLLFPMLTLPEIALGRDPGHKYRLRGTSSVEPSPGQKEFGKLFDRYLWSMNQPQPS